MVSVCHDSASVESVRKYVSATLMESLLMSAESVSQ